MSEPTRARARGYVCTRVCGVYVLVCRANGRAYVGSSLDVHARKREHVRALIRGKHHNRHMQRAWDKHGGQSFVFDVLARCKPEQRIALEQQYIDSAFRTGKPFNGNRSASTYTPMSRDREREVAALIASVTPEQWAKLSDVAVGVLVGLHRATVQAHRPRLIPSPGATREYLSAVTASAIACSPRAQVALQQRRDAAALRQIGRRAENALLTMPRRLERKRAARREVRHAAHV